MAETLVETPDANVADAPADDKSAAVVPDAPSTPETPEAAESTEAAEAKVEEAPTVEPEAEPELHPMEVAFREAQAEQAGKDGTDDDSSSEAPTEGDSQPPESTSTEPEPPKTPESTVDSLSVSSPDLERINTLVDQGREAELTPAQQGTLRRIREDAVATVRQEQATEDRNRRAFIEGETLRAEDPDAYNQLLDSSNGPTWLQFRRDFQQKYPEVSLEHPNFGEDNSASQVRPQVERDVKMSMHRDQMGVLASIAEGQGISKERFAALETETGGGYAMIPHLVAEAVKATLEKERPALAEAERTAALKEASALKIATAKTPTQAPGGVSGQGKQAGTYDDIGDAYLEAKQEMEKAGTL